MFALLVLTGCGTGRIEPPVRWDEVEAHAALQGCGPLPAELAGLEGLEPAAIRGRLRAWHERDPDARVAVPTSDAFDVLEAISPPEVPTDEEMPSIAHFVHTLDRCGIFVDEMLAVAIALTHCDPRSAAFADALAGYGGFGDLRGTAARQALWLWDAAAEETDRRWFGRWQARDLGAVLRDQVLAHEIGPLAPVDAYTTRPLISLVSHGQQQMWGDLLAQRATVAACLEVEPVH